MNLFEYSPCDLLIIPCSDSGTISKGFSEHLYRYGISSMPLENADNLFLGNVFNVPSSHEPQLAFAVTVQGKSRDKTNGAILIDIGYRIAVLASKQGLKTIACPLLCAGAGGVAPLLAFEKLVEGFVRGAAEGLSLIVCIPDDFTYKLVNVGKDNFKDEYTIVDDDVVKPNRDRILPDELPGAGDGSAVSERGRVEEDFLVEPDLRVRFASYDPDTVETRDAFNLRNELQAFANLISSTALKPPLSIGLFGNWGAGKSFFMRCLEEHIQKNAGSNSALHHDKVAQITFNAWHYMDANLWASLMSHILSELSTFVGNKTQDEQKQEELFRQLGITKVLKEEADCKVEATRHKLDVIKSEIVELNNKKLNLKRNLSDLSFKTVFSKTMEDEGVKALLDKAKVNLQTEGEWGSLEEINRTYQEYSGVGYRFSEGLRALFKVRGKAFYCFLFFLGALAVAGVISANFDNINITLKALLQVPAIASLLASVGLYLQNLKPVLRRLQEGSRYLKQAGDKIAELQRAAELDLDAQLKVVRQELHDLSQEELAVKLIQSEVQQKLDATLEEIKEIERGKRLDAFLEKRIASADYSQHLGLIALLRNDLDKLCRFLQSNQDQELHVDRIVLYIDDLDRCPPEKVVEVLQAVHLLLAFPLFVVVVGVDVRWIKHSLEANLFGAAAQGKTADSMLHLATPLDYLEKIFQIPYRLKQPDVEDKMCMLRNMVKGAGSLKEASYSDSKQAHAGIELDNDLLGLAEVAAAGESGGVGYSAGANTFESWDSPENLNEAHQVEVTSDEQAYMEKVMKQMPISPRSLKRYVNTFRLIKANPDWRCVNTNGDFLYMETLFLLAVSICCPKSTAAFFEKLRLSGNSDQYTHFLDAVVNDTKEKINSRNYYNPEIQSLDGLYPESTQGIPTEVANLKKVAQVVERFSFSYS